MTAATVRSAIRGSTASRAVTTSGLSANPDSHASAAALSGMDQLDAWGLFDKPAAAAYHRFVGRLYRPLLAAYGFDPRAGAYDGQDAETSQRRAQIVARLVGTAHDPALRGEEFVVVLPGLSAAQALASAEKLRTACAAEGTAGGDPAPAVTISIGLAETSGSRLPDLLRCADAALYEAKRKGRNRVECYAPPLRLEARA